MHKPEHFKWRVVVTVLVMVASSLFGWFYSLSAPVITGEAALLQMSNSDIAYVASVGVMRGLIPQVIGIFVALILLCVWVPPFWRGVSALFQKANNEDYR